jgi:hypothetical protein
MQNATGIVSVLWKNENPAARPGCVFPGTNAFCLHTVIAWKSSVYSAQGGEKGFF